MMTLVLRTPRSGECQYAKFSCGNNCELFDVKSYTHGAYAGVRTDH